MAGPLEGIRVVDCTRGTAGPRATGILADYGADVVWVEPPGGDPYRDALGVRYSVFNRGKRSVVLDLRDGADRQSMIELVRSADVFVESWRPGVADQLGLDHTSLHGVAPWVVTTSITGFGLDGPHRDVPGYEALVHALVGTMAEQRGFRDGPIFEGLPFASLGASSLAVIGTLAALHRREDDGVGRHVETDPSPPPRPGARPAHRRGVDRPRLRRPEHRRSPQPSSRALILADRRLRLTSND